MKNFKFQIFESFYSKLSHQLLLLLSIVLVLGCGDDANLNEDIQIKGGHQVERIDGQFEFKFGLFNDQGQPTTSFNQGDKIIFSFWITNNGNTDSRLLQSQYEDFFRVYKLDGPDTQIDMGQPHIGMFCQKNLGRPVDSGSSLKFQLPWIIATEGIDGGFLWCDGRNAPALEKGQYRTTFDQSFDFSINGQNFKTDVLSFTIDFTVN